MQAIDQSAINRIGNPLTLMQNAGYQVFHHIMEKIKETNIQPKILILCGTGNNGGDGLIAAQHLINYPISTQILIPENPKPNPMIKSIYEKIPKQQIKHNPSEINWDQYSIIIDAMFGTGLDRNIQGFFAQLVTLSNQTNALKVSIDLPTGIHANTGKIMGIAFKADDTITFFAPKIGHYIHPGKQFCGQIFTTDIGIQKIDCDMTQINYFLNHPDNWQETFISPKMNQHKYHRGHCLVIGAHSDYIGASKLTALAALRSGSGLVSILANQKTAFIYKIWASSVMIKSYRTRATFKHHISHPKINVLIHGMGSKPNGQNRKHTLDILKTKKTCVIDANALSCFEGKFKKIKPYLHQQAILTPHIKEFERLFSNHIDFTKGKLDQALNAAKRSGSIIVLKGNDTIIAHPSGKAYINYIAPNTLATAGSGDVLAGMIGAQLANHYDPFQAASRAVWQHSKAARHYRSGMIADDLISALLEKNISDPNEEFL